MYFETDVNMVKQEYEFNCKQDGWLKWLVWEWKACNRLNHYIKNHHVFVDHLSFYNKYILFSRNNNKFYTILFHLIIVNCFDVSVWKSWRTVKDMNNAVIHVRKRAACLEFVSPLTSQALPFTLSTNRKSRGCLPVEKRSGIHNPRVLPNHTHNRRFYESTLLGTVFESRIVPSICNKCTQRA